MKWITILFDETDCNENEYPSDIIVRKMNQIKAENFVLLAGDGIRFGRSENVGEDFYAEFAALVPDDYNDKNL